MLSRARFRYGAAGVIVVLALWEATARLGLVDPVLVSEPTAIAHTAVTQFSTGQIWPNLDATLLVWSLGFGLAAVGGIAIGIVGGLFRRIRYVTDAWLNASNVAPDLALVPILILWFGIGLKFKVVMVFIISVYYVAINTLAGVQSTEGRFLLVAQSFGCSRLHLVRSVVIPGSVPYIITGLRQGAARGVIGVVIAEFVSANKGIGFMISLSGSFLDTATVMFGIALLAVFGLVVSEVLGRLERRFDAWRPAR